MGDGGGSGSRRVCHTVTFPGLVDKSEPNKAVYIQINKNDVISCACLKNVQVIGNASGDTLSRHWIYVFQRKSPHIQLALRKQEGRLEQSYRTLDVH
jgi:hypothetical protein